MKNQTFEKQYKDHGADSQRKYPNEHLIAFIARNFYKAPDRKEVKILELGCGSGAQLWYIAREGFDVYGTDYSPTGLAICKETLTKWGTSATLAESDMTKIPFGIEFDAIVDVVSMQHLDITDHEKSYKAAFDALKPGGMFFSYHLGDNSIIFRHGGGKRIGLHTIDNVNDVSKPLSQNGLMTFLSPIDAEKMLQHVGFEHIFIEKNSRTYNNQEYAVEYLIIHAQKIKA